MPIEGSASELYVTEAIILSQAGMPLETLPRENAPADFVNVSFRLLHLYYSSLYQTF